MWDIWRRIKQLFLSSIQCFIHVGLSNVLSSFVGSFPITGSFSRFVASVMCVSRTCISMDACVEVKYIVP